MTVAEMLVRMSGQELADWQAYEQAHGPLGPVRGDWQAALIASVIANANRGRKGKQAKMKDFLLAWQSGATRMSAEETERVGAMLASRMGGTWTPPRQVAGGGEPR